MRLGQATVTDDAEGEVVSSASADGVTLEALAAAVADLTGPIAQVPSSVSAIKVDGKRSYARVRSGEQVELAARPVTVSVFDVLATRRTEPGLLDVDVEVECSSGTYVRALARDLGEVLGVGGHLTALRRTRVGPFALDAARTLEQLESAFEVVPLATAVATAFPVRAVDAETARVVAHGGRLPLAEEAGPTGVFGPAGEVLALMEPREGALRPLVVFA